MNCKVQELSIEFNGIVIHGVLPRGAAGKSKYNSEDIHLFDRIKYNCMNKPSISTSFFFNKTNNLQRVFAPQGIIVGKGTILNFNNIDSGSTFNDETGIRESYEGFENPTLSDIKNVIDLNNQNYQEIIIEPNYDILGLFLDLRPPHSFDFNLISEFYNQTADLGLKYYGLSSLGLIKIRPEMFQLDDVEKLQEGADLLEINSIII